MKKVLFFIAMGFSAYVTAQTATDALRYSYIRPGGTARFMGVGGAFTALGADFGALSQNPAGIALYRTSEFVLTPSLRFAATDAALPGEPSLRDEKSSFNLDNAGLIFHSMPRGGKWKTVNVGLGFNRQADFSQAIFYQGNANGTITNGYFDEANAVLANGGTEEGFDPFGTRLAWDANALYADQNGYLSYDFISDPQARINRLQTATTRGGVNEMLFSIGGNYAEKLMVGMTLGVPILRYEQETDYSESDPVDAVPFFDDLRQTNYLNTDGVGFDVKMGFIYHITQMFRLGASFHTPTWYSLTDNYSSTFSYSYTDGNGSVDGETIFSPEGVFDYRLRTPWRANVGGAVVVGKNGFVSADVEWVDYSSSRYNFDPNAPNSSFALQEREVNNQIQRNYRTATNLRFGAEWALENFRLRGGANLLGRPGADETGFDTAITGGVGVRVEGFYIDLGYRHFVSDGSLTAYNGAPIASLDNRNNEFLLTFGFKF